MIIAGSVTTPSMTAIVQAETNIAERLFTISTVGEGRSIAGLTMAQSLW